MASCVWLVFMVSLVDGGYGFGKGCGVEKMNVAVMGCVVNGPGESQHADIGISLPGTGEHPVCPVFINGKRGPTLKGENITEEFQKLISKYVEERYGTDGTNIENSKKT